MSPNLANQVNNSLHRGEWGWAGKVWGKLAKLNEKLKNQIL